MSRQSWNMLAQGFGQGLNNLASGYAENVKKTQQQELIREFTDPSTPLQRKNQIGVMIDPKYATQIAKENQYSGNLSQIMGMLNKPSQSIDPMERAGIPEGMQPDINPKEAQMPPLNVQPQGINELIQETRQQDPYFEQKQEIERLQNAALFASSKPGMSTLANDLDKRADRIASDIRSDKENISKDRREREKQVTPIQAKALETQKSTNTVLNAFNNQLDLVKRDKLGPTSRANFSKFLKDHGFSESIANAFQSPEGALFNTQNKEIVAASLKTAFGARPIGTEFEAFMDMLAKEGRVKEANELGIRSMMLPAQIDNEVSKATLQAIKENPEISPIQLQTLQYEAREEATDRLEGEWQNEKNRILESLGNRRSERTQGSIFPKQSSPQGFTRMQNPKDGLYYDVPNSRLG